MRETGKGRGEIKKAELAKGRGRNGLDSKNHRRAEKYKQDPLFFELVILQDIG
jgi:hypothetical protein